MVSKIKFTMWSHLRDSFCNFLANRKSKLWTQDFKFLFQLEANSRQFKKSACQIEKKFSFHMSRVLSGCCKAESRRVLAFTGESHQQLLVEQEDEGFQHSHGQHWQLLQWQKGRRKTKSQSCHWQCWSWKKAERRFIKLDALILIWTVLKKNKIYLNIELSCKQCLWICYPSQKFLSVECKWIFFWKVYNCF